MATLISVSRVPTQRRVKRQSNERVQHTDFLKSRRSPYRCLLKSPAGGRPVARQSVPAGLPGEHTLKETLVPIPNTTVKLLGPMIVPTSAKVGHRRVHFNTPSGSPRRGVLLRPLPTATLAGTLGLPLGAGLLLLGAAVVRPPSAVRICGGSAAVERSIVPRPDSRLPCRWHTLAPTLPTRYDRRFGFPRSVGSLTSGMVRPW